MCPFGTSQTPKGRRLRQPAVLWSRLQLGHARIICLPGHLHRDKKRHDVGATRGHCVPFRGLGADSMCKTPPSFSTGPGSLSSGGGRPKTQAKARTITAETTNPAAGPRKSVAKIKPQPFIPIRSAMTKASEKKTAPMGKPKSGLNSLDLSGSLQVGHTKGWERRSALGTSPPQTGHFISRILSPGGRCRQATAATLIAL